MSRAIFFAIAATIIMTSGCSFKQPTGEPLQVRLEPRSQADALQLANYFSMPAIAATAPTSLSGLGCFAVNVVGGTISSAIACGSLNVGITDGPYQGIDSSFSPLVPLSDGLTFEALGMPGSSCPKLGESGFAGTIYRIGRTQANIGSEDSKVVIPVSFNPADSFSCGQGLYTVFSDTFSYVDTSSAQNLSPSLTNNVWATSPTTGLQNSNGRLEFAGGSAFSNVVTKPFDSSKPHTRFSAKVQVISGTGSPTFKIGFIDSNTATPTSGVLCHVSYSFTSGLGTLTVSNGAGAVLDTKSITQTISTSLDGTLTCDIKTVNGVKTARAGFTGSSSPTPAQADVTSSFSGSMAELYHSPAGTVTTTIDDFTIEQANEPQF